MSNQEKNIARILRASNHFEMLKLPKPYSDLLEQPVWDCDADQVIGAPARENRVDVIARRRGTTHHLQVNRAYRKLSLCCHPDKSSHPDAPRAFEALKKAKAVLTHPLDKDDYLRDFVKQSKIAWEGNWNGVHSVFAEKERMSKMREDAQAMQGESVADAMRERCVGPTSCVDGAIWRTSPPTAMRPPYLIPVTCPMLRTLALGA